jgi:S-formylglutathione hydrolase FrmB
MEIVPVRKGEKCYGCLQNQFLFTISAEKFPEHFGYIVALSSALIVHEVAGIKEGESNDVANYEYYFHCFGRLDMAEESTNNPETLILQMAERKQSIPKLFMACGTEDFLLEENRRFHNFLEEHQIEHLYYESPGIHDMVFWKEYFWKAAAWIAGGND